MLPDFYSQAHQGKIAAEDEEEIGEDSQFMMLAKKVTAKALQKNGELLALHGGCPPDCSCWSLGGDSSLQRLLQLSHGPVSNIILKGPLGWGEAIFFQSNSIGQ